MNDERQKVIRALSRLDNKFAELHDRHSALIDELARIDGFVSCIDCFNNRCTMNCSNAPIYMKVMA